jgi:nitrite reductase/ring-hydroxylating ferredoxin subunit
MELPDSVKALGEQIEGGGEIAAASELFEAYDVFSAEVAQIFTKRWLAVEHASRLAEDGNFVRAEVGSRSVVVVREKEDKIHAMRNACLHAGYRICEEAAGKADSLYCIYHGWSYALDGMLTDPLLRPDMKDRTRFRLARYAMQIERGLILVDLSTVGAEPPPAAPVDLGAIPEDLGERPVSRRLQHKTTMNWKRLRQFLWAEPGLAFGNGSVDEVVELGPLSLVALKDGDAAMLRLVPRYPGQTEIEIVELRSAAAAADPIGDALREHGESLAAAPLTRGFYDWYWPLMAPLAAPA